MERRKKIYEDEHHLPRRRQSKKIPFGQYFYLLAQDLKFRIFCRYDLVDFFQNSFLFHLVLFQILGVCLKEPERQSSKIYWLVISENRFFWGGWCYFNFLKSRAKLKMSNRQILRSMKQHIYTEPHNFWAFLSFVSRVDFRKWVWSHLFILLFIF